MYIMYDEIIYINVRLGDIKCLAWFFFFVAVHIAVYHAMNLVTIPLELKIP